MPIPLVNRQKIAIITNSLIPQSFADAQDYINRRGLNANLILSFDFPAWNPAVQGPNYGGNYLNHAWCYTYIAGLSPRCTTAGYTGLTFYQACINFYAANSIEAVACSTWTPAGVAGAGGPSAMSLAAAAGNAYWMNQLTGGFASYLMAKAHIVASIADVGFTDIANFVTPDSNGSTNSAFQNVQPHNQDMNWPCSTLSSNWKANYTGQIPHGRLGCPDFITPVVGGSGFNGPIKELTLANGVSCYANAMSMSMQSELVNHSADLHLTSNNLSYVSHSADMNHRSNVFLNGLGFNTKTLEVSGGDYLTSEFYNNINVPANVFAFCIGYGNNTPIATYYYPTSQPVENGAWLWTWQSGSGIVAANFLKQGGVASQGNVQEPTSLFAGAMPFEAMFLMVTQGCSMMEANFIACPTDSTGTPNFPQAIYKGWSTYGAPTVYGDPLYSPYANTRIANYIKYPGINNSVQMPNSVIQGYTP